MSDIKENHQTQSDLPILCKNCQKFFGNTQQLDLCSKCFKEFSVIKPKQQIVEILEIQIETPQKGKIIKITKYIKDEIQVKQKEKTKCFKCNKKVGLLGFECKCTDVFCKEHRMPEKHECSFNFKEENQKKLQENNPQIKPSKFEKI